MPASLQYVYHPTPAWPQYKKGTPVFLNTVCVPPAPPAPPQQVFGYYILPQPSPQFIVPQATLQPWGAVKGWRHNKGGQNVPNSFELSHIASSLWIQLNLGQKEAFVFFYLAAESYS